MFRPTPGDAKIAGYLIGFAVLGGPLLALGMALRGRPAAEFVFLGAICLASLVSGAWIVIRYWQSRP